MRSESIGIPGDCFTLFVYGTLMRGGVRHHVLSKQRFLGTARTRPHYVLLDLGAYPGLVHRAVDGRAIHGELYEVATSLIETLDRVECAPSLYRLEPVFIEGHTGDVFTYIFQQDTDGLALCPGDRWING